MDIDITVRRPEDVADAATVLPTPHSFEPGMTDEGPAWISTVRAPTLDFGDEHERWTFGVWLIQGVKVELAHIDAPPVASLMLETRSVAVWSERDTLTCQGELVPIVPLETQLATMAARGQTARLDAVLAAIDHNNSNLNLPLLRRAFVDRQSDTPGLVVPEPVQVILDRGC